VFVADTLQALVRNDRETPLEVAAEAWPAVIERAGATDSLGLIALAAGAAGAPVAVQRELDLHLTREARHQALCLVEAERLCAALAAGGIESVVLKGAALARTVYPRPGVRTFRDLDLLVRPAQREDAHRLLLTLGYRDAVPPALVEVYRRHHFHFILEGLGRPRVELHWSLVRPDEPYRLSADDLLHEAQEIAGINRFPCPHPDGHVLHVASSLLRSGFTELKRLIDLDRLIRSGASIRWERVAGLATERGLSPALRLSLDLCAELLGTDVGQATAAIAPLGPVRQRLDAIGVRSFPWHDPPADWRPVRHIVRYWLLQRRLHVVTQFIANPRFERARLAALGTPLSRRLLVTGKRAVIAAWLAAWQVGLVSAPVHRSRP
jgi:hypothetical protein